MDVVTGMMGFATKGAGYMHESFGIGSIVLKAIVIVLVFVWILMLVNCLQRDFKVATDKLAWIVVLVFLPILGAFIYLFDVLKLKRKK